MFATNIKYNGAIARHDDDLHFQESRAYVPS